MEKREKVRIENKAILKIVREKKQVTIRDIRIGLWKPEINIQLSHGSIAIRLKNLEEKGIIKKIGKQSKETVFALYNEEVKEV